MQFLPVVQVFAALSLGKSLYFFFIQLLLEFSVKTVKNTFVYVKSPLPLSLATYSDLGNHRQPQPSMCINVRVASHDSVLTRRKEKKRIIIVKVTHRYGPLFHFTLMIFAYAGMKLRFRGPRWVVRVQNAK